MFFIPVHHIFPQVALKAMLLLLGKYLALTDGSCSLIDAVYCVNPIAKRAANLGSVAFTSAMLCPPGAIALGVVGFTLRKAGKYAVSAGNNLEVKPTLTKISGVITSLLD